jgi:hypothetical protein
LKGDGAAELLHCAFMRQSLGVRTSTGRALLLRELNRVQVNVAWLQQCLRFYNKIMRRPSDDVVRRACVDDIAMAGAGCTSAWSSHLAKCMGDVGCASEQQAMLSGRQVKVDAVVNAFKTKQAADAWAGADHLAEQYGGVRDVPDTARGGFKHHVYAQLFAPKQERCAIYTSMLWDRKQITAMSRLCLGSHSLGVESARHAMDESGKLMVVPRSQRLCKMCSMGDRDDEYHMLCVCPAFTHLRSKHLRTCEDLDPDAHVRYVLNDEHCDTLKLRMSHWRGVASYVVAVNELRDATGGQAIPIQGCEVMPAEGTSNQ